MNRFVKALLIVGVFVFAAVLIVGCSPAQPTDVETVYVTVEPEEEPTTVEPTPEPTPEPEPTTEEPAEAVSEGEDFSDYDMTYLSLSIAWPEMAAEDRQSICDAMVIMGTDWVTDAYILESEATWNRQAVYDFFSNDAC